MRFFTSNERGHVDLNAKKLKQKIVPALRVAPDMNVKATDTPSEVLQKVSRALEASMNLTMFFVLVQAHFAEKYENNNAGNIHCVLSSWATFALAKYESATVNPKLKIASGNAAFTQMRVLPRGSNIKSESLFVKVQYDDGADDVRVDAVQACAIQAILKTAPQRFGRHYQDFIDSYSSFVDATGDSLRLLLKESSQLEPLKVPTHSSDGEWKTISRSQSPASSSLAITDFGFQEAYPPCKCVVLRNIIGTSLMELLMKAKTKPEILTTMLSDLFVSMRYLGKYGFAHNDLHANNVLLDSEAGCFKLIDYGQVWMDGTRFDDDVRSLVNDRLTREALKFDPMVHYQSTLNRYLPYNTFVDPQSDIAQCLRAARKVDAGIDAALIPHLFMFDVVAVVINVLRAYPALGRNMRASPLANGELSVTIPTFAGCVPGSGWVFVTELWLSAFATAFVQERKKPFGVSESGGQITFEDENSLIKHNGVIILMEALAPAVARRALQLLFEDNDVFVDEMQSLCAARGGQCEGASPDASEIARDLVQRVMEGDPTQVIEDDTFTEPSAMMDAYMSRQRNPTNTRRSPAATIVSSTPQTVALDTRVPLAMTAGARKKNGASQKPRPKKQ